MRSARIFWFYSAAPKRQCAKSSKRECLAPNSADSYVAESVVMLVSGNPQAAERAARQALALDAENEAAGDTLADALRMQGKLDESDAQILGLLARNPENPWTHSSAGMLALQKGDGRAAERHFLAALRIDPEHSEAREGLLHAFRARSPFYGAYLKYTFTMERLGRGRRGFVVIGLLLLMQLANITFVGRLAPIGFALVAAYCLFVLWIWVARGVGNLFLLFDQFARHALGAGEKKRSRGGRRRRDCWAHLVCCGPFTQADQPDLPGFDICQLGVSAVTSLHQPVQDRANGFWAGRSLSLFRRRWLVLAAVSTDRSGQRFRHQSVRLYDDPRPHLHLDW